MSGPNTSATGGFLAPFSVDPLYDSAFDALIQLVTKGITGLPGDLVRPRWQETPPVQPERSVTWCAIGVSQSTADTNSVIVHRSAMTGDDGHSDSYRVENVQLTASFYGPNAMSLCGLLRDGLWISQNREELGRYGVTLYDVDPILSVPELVNDKWLNRADMTIRLKRVVGRQYPILNLLSASGVIISDRDGLETNWQTPSMEH